MMVSMGRTIHHHGSYGIIWLMVMVMSLMVVHGEEIVIDIGHLVNEHRVNSIPGLLDEYRHDMFAGHIPIHEPTLRNNGSLFYFLVESQKNPRRDPLIIWLNGGPGCSSLTGLFLENGPFRIKSSTSLVLNQFSWNTQANVLYIDQPIGTGLSLEPGDIGRPFAKTQREINIMFSKFLSRFLQMYPTFRGRDLWLAGESYAGHYIPHFAHHLLSSRMFNLKGVLIGNGYTHPVTQLSTLPDFAVALGLIGTAQHAHLRRIGARCVSEAVRHEPSAWHTCRSLFESTINATGTEVNGYVNVYDHTQQRMLGDQWPKEQAWLTNYLNRDDVRKAIHSRASDRWSGCNLNVFFMLQHEQLFGTIHLFPELLDRVPVLVYNGLNDFICNHLGTELYLLRLPWQGRAQFATSQRSIWTVGEHTAGYVKSAGNLTYLTILGASHLAPYSQPMATLDMVLRFMAGRSFHDIYQDIGVTYDDGMATLPKPRDHAHRGHHDHTTATATTTTSNNDDDKSPLPKLPTHGGIPTRPLLPRNKHVSSSSSSPIPAGPDDARHSEKEHARLHHHHHHIDQPVSHHERLHHHHGSNATNATNSDGDMMDDVWDDEVTDASPSSSPPGQLQVGDHIYDAQEPEREPVLSEFPFGSPTTSDHQWFDNDARMDGDDHDDGENNNGSVAYIAPDGGYDGTNMSNVSWWNRPLELPAWALCVFVLVISIAAVITARCVFPPPSHEYQSIDSRGDSD